MKKAPFFHYYEEMSYQLINGEKIPFSEREIILREAALRRDTQAAPVENHDRIL